MAHTSLAYTQRQEKTNEFCERVTSAVAIISPAGLDSWDGLWEFVDGPNAEFLLTLSAWEADPTDDAFQDIERASSSLCSAWQYASAAFLCQGTSSDKRSEVAP